MTRRLRLTNVALILIGFVVLVVALIWWADGHRATAQLVAGLALVVGGVGLTVLHFTASDNFLNRHFGAPGAAEMRRAGRRGWVGMLLGGALLGMLYLDRQAQAIATESQLKAALERGRAGAKSGDWPAAADAYTEAIRLDPNRARAHASRGVAFIHLGELDRAVADLSEAIRLDPSDARVIYNRGIVHLRKGDFDRAVADLSEAIRLDPKFARAFLARSLVYRALGDDAKASADRERAIELDPSLEKVKDVNVVSRNTGRCVA